MSAGEFCQNNMMDRTERKGACLDTLHNFIAALLLYRRSNPDKCLVALQIKQVVTTNYPTRAEADAGVDRGPLVRRVDWRSCFGSRGSPRLWNSLMGLVLWVAIHVDLIRDIFAYVDDLFGWDEEESFHWYSRYEQMMPSKEVAVLQLWDQLGIPHSKEKQLRGAVLVIIGFLVDVNEMTVTLPSDAKANLILAVEDFIRSPTRKRSLHDWQQLAGWINWSFNVFPLLRPALCHVYIKIAQKDRVFATVYINLEVKRDLSCLDDDFRDRFQSYKYERTKSFKFIEVDELKEMGFLRGGIAELKVAVAQWSQPANVE
ncbi:hypothetical protein B0H14DRAFT_3448166 [Mycena olivaceomarginata]|nr:hypothetical protein B0H14DRAFT_3448166 [Mycena olivaceomarginata]